MVVGHSPFHEHNLMIVWKMYNNIWFSCNDLHVSLYNRHCNVLFPMTTHIWNKNLFHTKTWYSKNSYNSFFIAGEKMHLVAPRLPAAEPLYPPPQKMSQTPWPSFYIPCSVTISTLAVNQRPLHVGKTITLTKSLCNNSPTWIGANGACFSLSCWVDDAALEDEWQTTQSSLRVMVSMDEEVDWQMHRYDATWNPEHKLQELHDISNEVSSVVKTMDWTWMVMMVFCVEDGLMYTIASEGEEKNRIFIHIEFPQGQGQVHGTSFRCCLEKAR